MGVVGRPRDWSFRMHVCGRFKMRRAGPWKRCEVGQAVWHLPEGRFPYAELDIDPRAIELNVPPAR